MIGKTWWFAPVVAGLSLFVGCKPDEEIRTYTVEKEPEKPRLPEREPAPATDAKFRLLGAIIPDGKGYSWFVRFYGPIDQVSPHEEDFQTFLNSLRLGGEGSKSLTWTVPAGWTLGPPKDMRIVTLKKGAAEFYVSSPIGGSLLDNVNSWRAQIVGIDKVTEAELPTVTTELLVGTTKAVRVDFRGPGGKGRGMAGPFSGKN